MERQVPTPFDTGKAHTTTTPGVASIGQPGTLGSFDIVTACRRKDLATLQKARPLLQQFIPHRRLIVFTARPNHPLFRLKLGSSVVILDEDEIVPQMTLESLRRKVKLPGFPAGAGWYFQQFLKLAYPRLEPQAKRYLIWDADTLPLRPMQPFTETGEACLVPATDDCAEPPDGISADEKTRQLLRRATRPHAPYFDNYEHLLGESAERNQSFISQHMPIQVECLNHLLSAIEDRWPGKDGWAWKIIQNLRGKDANLFSEYEFYAQYALRHFPALHKIRELRWRRGGVLLAGQKAQSQLKHWSREFDFVALEAWASPWRRALVKAYLRLPEMIRRMFRMGV